MTISRKIKISKCSNLPLEEFVLNKQTKTTKTNKQKVEKEKKNEVNAKGAMENSTNELLSSLKAPVLVKFPLLC